MFNLKVLLVMMKYELKQAADFEKKTLINKDFIAPHMMYSNGYRSLVILEPVAFASKHFRDFPETSFLCHVYSPSGNFRHENLVGLDQQRLQQDSFLKSKESKYDRSWFQRLHFGYRNQSPLKHDRSIILGLQTGNQNTPDRKTSSLLILKIIQVTVKDAYCEPQ